MRISDWSSDVCSSDLAGAGAHARAVEVDVHQQPAVFRRADQERLALHRERQAGRVPAIAIQKQVLAIAQPEQRDWLEAAVAGRAEHDRVVRLHAAELGRRSEEHTSELQSLMRISYAVFCLKKKNNT